MTTLELSSDLTARQMEVLGLVARGYSNPHIAKCLKVAKCTVENHINHIFQALGIIDDRMINRRVVAALYYFNLIKRQQ